MNVIGRGNFSTLITNTSDSFLYSKTKDYELSIFQKRFKSMPAQNLTLI